MLAYFTYCSAEKNYSNRSISAIKLYKSERISNVHKDAQANNIQMFILSGKYGVISAQHKINYYDHLLKDEEVDMHSELVTNQLKELGIRELVFFSNKLENDNNLAPYHSCIKKACNNAGIKLTIEESNYID